MQKQSEAHTVCTTSSIAVSRSFHGWSDDYFCINIPTKDWLHQKAVIWLGGACKSETVQMLVSHAVSRVFAVWKGVLFLCGTVSSRLRDAALISVVKRETPGTNSSKHQQHIRRMKELMRSRWEKYGKLSLRKPVQKSGRCLRRSVALFSDANKHRPVRMKGSLTARRAVLLQANILLSGVETAIHIVVYLSASVWRLLLQEWSEVQSWRAAGEQDDACS